MKDLTVKKIKSSIGKDFIKETKTGNTRVSEGEGMKVDGKNKIEWDDMPEFVQEKQEPFSKIIVRFETKKDLEDFADLIGQKLTPKTKSIWYPFKSHWHGKTIRWVDEP